MLLVSACSQSNVVEQKVTSLLTNVPAADVSTVSETAQSFDPALLVPKNLPFTVNKATADIVTVDQSTNMKRLIIKFYDTADKTVLDERVDGEKGQVVDWNQAVKLANGATAYYAKSTNFASLSWNYAGMFYTLESAQTDVHGTLLTLQQLQAIANSMINN